MGLRNLLLVTGDPGRVGDYPDATAVFDVDSIGLTNVVSRLNHGCDIGGQAIGAPTGVSHRRVGEPERARISTRSCGASSTRSRPAPSSWSRGRSSTCAGFERFLKRIEHARLPIIAGIFPFESARNAEFMANEVPGVRVPDALLERMRARPTARGGRGRGHGDRPGDRRRPARRWSRASRSSTQSGDIEAALAVLDGLR